MRIFGNRWVVSPAEYNKDPKDQRWLLVRINRKGEKFVSPFPTDSPFLPWFISLLSLLGACDIVPFWPDHSAQIKKLEDLIHHAWVHSGYQDCGYMQMTMEQKSLYDSVLRSQGVTREGQDAASAPTN